MGRTPPLAPQTLSRTLVSGLRNGASFSSETGSAAAIYAQLLAVETVPGAWTVLKCFSKSACFPILIALRLHLHSAMATSHPSKSSLSGAPGVAPSRARNKAIMILRALACGKP